jgi:hypothetical protein
MSDDNAQTSGNSEVAATTSKQMIERSVKGMPAPAAAPVVPPWTAAFDLPSIRAPETKPD